MKKVISAVSISLLLFGCASTQRIIDTQGVDMNAYAIDEKQCMEYSGMVEDNTAAYAVGGAAVGAVIGAIFAAALGVDPGYGAAYGATSYGVTGLAAGAYENNAQTIAVYRNCMIGRGYKVLN